jgi:hypothetical protein
MTKAKKKLAIDFMQNISTLVSYHTTVGLLEVMM